MTTMKVARPIAGTYAPYYDRYIEQAPDGDVLQALETEIRGTVSFLGTIPKDRELHRYAEGKWSIREVIGHLADTERIFVYRALRFARADRTELPGFDENAFVANADFDRRTLADLTEEFRAVRAATVSFFRGLSAEQWERAGSAKGNPMSVRALPFIVLGHERHHVRILKERYL